MKLILSPIRCDWELPVVSVKGSVLTINGEAFDFGPLPEGAVLPGSAVNSKWIIGNIEKVNGEITLTLIRPHGRNPTQAEAFPEPITIKSGKVKL